MTSVPSVLLEAALPSLCIAALLIAVLPWLRRESTIVRGIFAGCAILSAFVYVSWRLSSSLPPPGWTLDWFFGVLFFAFELATIAGVLITYIFLSKTRTRSQDVEENLTWLHKQPKAKLVDVFICTYNEEPEILTRTINGALSMDYANFRVWVLDDGRRSWVQDLCKELGCNYVTRADNRHAKAGNINNALRHVAELPRIPDYISILDADFVPVPEFLTRTLCLFRETKVGVVQTPQHFVNPDPLQSNLKAATVWPDEQRFFFDVVMASKDAWGAAFCCGTSCVIRYDALMQIGGFPTDSVTEDFLVTLKLKARGFETVYLNERLSFGLAPEGLKEYITQRSRWCLGLMQICRGPSGPFQVAQPVSFIYRLCLVESFLYWAASHTFRLLCLVIPTLYLLCDIRAVQADLTDALAHFLPYFVVQTAFVAWISGGRIMPVVTDAGQLIVAPEILKAVAVGLFGSRDQKFKVTAKGGDRSRLVVQWPLLKNIILALIAVGMGILFAYLLGNDRDMQLSSVLALSWSWYNILVLVIAGIICIELPRTSDDLTNGQWLRVMANGRSLDLKLIKLADCCLTVRSEMPVEAGRAKIVLDEDFMPAHIQAISNNVSELRLLGGHSDERRLIRYLYGHVQSAPVHDTSYLLAAKAISARIFA